MILYVMADAAGLLVAFGLAYLIFCAGRTQAVNEIEAREERERLKGDQSKRRYWL